MSTTEQTNTSLALDVVEVGTGPTVGYLHGPLGNPSAHPFLRALGGDHRVVAPCLPGFNGSPPARVTDFYDWVFHTSVSIDDVGLAGAPCVAASIGGMLALEVAAVRPEAFERLVLIAPFGLWDPERPVLDLWSERTKHQTEFLLADPSAASDFFDEPEGADVEALMDAEIQRYRTRRSAASLTWQIPEYGLDRRLGRVRCPVHLVWGSADRIIDPAYAERFAALLPNCTGVDIIDGAGHLAEWDAPEQVAETVRRILG